MKNLTAICLILLIAGCSEPQVATSAGEDPAQLARQAIQRAEARYLESRNAGHAWTPTGVHLQNAKQALETADYDSAASEAAHALALADASLVQARAEQSAWRERFPVLRVSSE